jgi:hypothetical protein
MIHLITSSFICSFTIIGGECYRHVYAMLLECEIFLKYMLRTCPQIGIFHHFQ